MYVRVLSFYVILGFVVYFFCCSCAAFGRNKFMMMMNTFYLLTYLLMTGMIMTMTEINGAGVACPPVMLSMFGAPSYAS